MQLERLHFIDILSLAPRSQFFQPLSWKVLTGFDRTIASDGAYRMGYRLNAGGGLSYHAGALGIVSFLAESDAGLGRLWKDGYTVGFGPSIDVYTTMTDRWKVGISVRELFYALGDQHRSMQASIMQNILVFPDNCISLIWRGDESYRKKRAEALIGWQVFF